MLGDSKNIKPLELNIVFLVYGLLALISMVWDWLSRGHPFQAWIDSKGLSLSMLITAAVLVVSYLGLSYIVNRLFRWARQLEHLFAQLLTPISYFQIIVISLLSGVVEEWFFRGILLSHFGVLTSSIVFGLCHLIPERGVWMWSIWSFFAGVIFALIYETSESLWLCVLIHSAVNASVLVILNHKVIESPHMSSSAE